MNMNQKQQLHQRSDTVRRRSFFRQWLERGAQSHEHAEFLKKLRIRSISVRIVQIGILCLFLGLWEVASRQHWIDPLLFSRPSGIWNLFITMLVDGELTRHITATVLETVAAFILATLMGTFMAMSIWWSDFLSRVAEPYLVVLNGMPKVALGPIFIVAFGAGLGAIIATGIAISIIITTIVVHSSFQEVDPHYIKLARSFGATKKQIFQKIIFPASLPAIISTLKVNVGLAWVGVIVGEFLVSKFGLGYLIIYGFQVFNLTLVFVSLFIVALCATIMYQAVASLEKYFRKRRGA